MSETRTAVACPSLHKKLLWFGLSNHNFELTFGQFLSRMLFLSLLLVVMTMSGSAQEWVVHSVDFSKKEPFAATASDILNRFDQVISTLPKSLRYAGTTDHEDRDVLMHIMYGRVGGIVLEIGALDGTTRTHSQSALLERFGWKRILIEANPLYRDALSQQSNAFAVSAAICASRGKVHYATTGGYTAGIVEFMRPAFLQKFHPYIYELMRTPGDLEGVDYSKVPAAKKILEIPCVPMQDVLDAAKVKHVDLMILDTEGAEYNILQTIDFTRVRFSVIIVESDERFREAGYQAEVQEFLEARGYVCMTKALGRNSWYRHQSFQPTTFEAVARRAPFTFNYDPLIVTTKNYASVMKP